MKRMRCFAVPLLALLTPLLSPVPSHAAFEPGTGVVAGYLVDEFGTPLPQGSVQVEGTNRLAITDENGVFRIVDVPAGMHTVVVRLTGFNPARRDSVRVDSGETTSLEIRLQSKVLRYGPPVKIKGTRGPTLRRPEPRRDFQADSDSLYGTWRWLGTYGGMTPTRQEPPATGWFRELYFRRDGTYSFWEVDSLGSMPLCSGQFTIHRAGRSLLDDGSQAALWIDLEGWWLKGDGKQLVTFSKDMMITYPGSESETGSTSVSDALTSKYVKKPRRVVPLGSASPNEARIYAQRPPRLQRSAQDSYSLETSGLFYRAQAGAGNLFQWRDAQFPASVLKSYTYTNQQVPSAVIGDFDGDSLSDAVVYGTDERNASSKVLCVLSHRGDPIAFSVLEEPTLLDPPSPSDTSPTKWREPHPEFYLSLYPAGQRIQDAGKARKLRNDAFLVSRIGGRPVAYYWDNGMFRTASIPSPAPIRGKAGRRREVWIPPCPAPAISTNAWVRVYCQKFSFLLPRQFKELKVQGIDSYVRAFQTADSSATLSFDAGGFSDPLTRVEEYERYQSCSERIGGKPARLITGILRSQQHRTRAASAWRDITGPGVHLTMWGDARDENYLRTILAILRTVRFQEK